MAGGGSAAGGVGGCAATLGGRRQLAGQGQAAARRRGRAAVRPREAGGQRSRAAGNKHACPSTHGSQNVAVEMEEEEGQMEEHVVQELGEERVEENFEGITKFNPDYIGCV
uniref:Uncharacterized protein n=1 Tax=Oryza rufipogon TaxID=4529 RepID=A0A0E0P254_ORYRU